MLLVDCLPGDAEGLGNLLPGPAEGDGSVDGLSLHAVSHAAQRHYRGESGGRILVCQSVLLRYHSATLPSQLFGVKVP